MGLLHLIRNIVLVLIILVTVSFVSWKVWGQQSEPIPSFSFLFVSPDVPDSSNTLASDANIEIAVTVPAVPEEVMKWFTYSGDILNSTNGLAQESEELLVYAFKKFLIPPIDNDEPYNLKEPNVTEQSWGDLTPIVKKILKNKTNGFFVECGALDGETRSNSLSLERFMGWSGLLIEASPSNFQSVVSKKRKAWLAPTCLSIKPHPITVTFEEHFNIGKINSISKESNPILDKSKKLVEVQCMPLTTLLLAIDKKTVDYFSLDVEGSELEVLKTINFDLIDIKTLSVEFAHGLEKKEEMKTFMDSKGYDVYASLQNDFIFVKKGLQL